MQNAVGNGTEKNAKKKTQTCAGSASCGGPAGGGEGSCFVSILSEGCMQNCANCLARRGDLLRRAAEFQRLRLMPPTPSDLGFEILRFEVLTVQD